MTGQSPDDHGTPPDTFTQPGGSGEGGQASPGHRWSWADWVLVVAALGVAAVIVGDRLGTSPHPVRTPAATLSAGAPPTTTAVSVDPSVTPFLVINTRDPGGLVDISRYVFHGRHTVFEFFSPRCAPCTRSAPFLAALAQTGSRIAVRRVLVDRPGVEGPDFESPVARQFSLERLPGYVVFNPQGIKVYIGEQAQERVEWWLREAGLMR